MNDETRWTNPALPMEERVRDFLEQSPDTDELTQNLVEDLWRSREYWRAKAERT